MAPILNYYLIHEPDGPPSDTLLLILQGSDCNTVLKNESIFTEYKNVWPEADVLLIDKYGIDRGLSFSSDAERKDCPPQYIHNDSPEQRVVDIQAVLDIVREDNKYLNLIIFGGSEGAVIANLVTTRIDDVNATVSFNGGGQKFIDDVLHSIKSGSESDDEAAESIQGFRGFYNHILNSEPSDLEVSGHGYDWWHQMLSIDQLEILKEVNTPLLVIQGGRDLSVSPQKVDEMVQALINMGKNNIDYRTYKDLGHGFKNTEGESKRNLVINNINVWLKSKLGSPE
ncbi:alpha/beta hydrolase family protein [Oceanimonas baumannii]|uniref:alpha/beta hydrolase family protein n=1 Tax=Oceanimonas baumannii TaxID=129578 RepID=UPI003A916D7C